MKCLILLFLTLIFATPSGALEEVTMPVIPPDPCDSSYVVLSDSCPSDKPFLPEDCWSTKLCTSCEDEVTFADGHEKDFEICDNRETVQRNGKLYSVKKCPSDFPLRKDWDFCVSCQSVQWVKVKEADCLLCGDWRTMKEWKNELYCVLNKSPDPDRPLVENSSDADLLYNAHLFSCDEPRIVKTTKENCDLCPNREYVDGVCKLKETE